MNGYYGTDAQQRLQRKSDNLAPWIMRTPGACLTGRIMGTDDPDRLGWDVIQKHIEEDGAFSFRWIDPAGLKQIQERARDSGWHLHGWTGFCNNTGALRAFEAAPNTGCRGDGLTFRLADRSNVTSTQAFFAENGITPLSAAVLTGAICPARTVLLAAPDGSIAAAGFVGMLQNRFSEFRNWAWAGLIAASVDQRGRGLGRLITQELIRHAIFDLGASSVMACAAPDNSASCAMLQGCGLLPVDRASYVATLTQTRFSR